MVETQDRGALTGSLKAYLEELLESGVDELEFGAEPAAPRPQQAAPPRRQAFGAEAAGAAVPPAAPVAPHSGAAAVPGSTATAADSAGFSAPAAAASAEEPFRALGNPKARLVMVMRGNGFEGEAGELLAKIVQAMGFVTSDICLVCYGDRAQERRTLLDLIAGVGPEVVVTLGEEPARLLLRDDQPLAAVRGRFHTVEGLPLMPTLHPEAMLADPALKREVWSEMQQVMRRLAQPTLAH